MLELPVLKVMIPLLVLPGMGMMLDLIRLLAVFPNTIN